MYCHALNGLLRRLLDVENPWGRIALLAVLFPQEKHVLYVY